MTVAAAIAIVLVALWVICAVVVAWLYFRREYYQPQRHCCCGKFALDDKDPLVTSITIHEEQRCQPCREAIR